VEEVEAEAKDIESPVNEERDEGGFDEIEEGYDHYLPLHLLEAVLVPAHSHQPFHDRNEQHFE
jgi:hypothetical protein